MIQDITGRLDELVLDIFSDRPLESVSDFCTSNLYFDEPDNNGPYSLAGREYVREPLDSFGDQLISDAVFVFGSQAGKTGIMMGGIAWIIKYEASRVLWVMANEKQARTFSETRWIPMCKRSFPTLLPGNGKRNNKVKNLQQAIGASVVNFFGSNSASNLASIPARVVVQDEVDKFDMGGKKEADAVNLADQRTKNFGTPKRVKSSTPTLVSGLIWQEFLKTDQRRRFVPCPFCGKHVVFVWSKEHTTFAPTGFEAYIKWDQEARREDGSWDLDRVERSARAECPHCGGHITDAYKTKIDRLGEWRPTKNAARGYAGWHLPSLYAASAQTTFGKLAIKFLQAKKSIQGIQGFVNGDLAEPWEESFKTADVTRLSGGYSMDDPIDGPHTVIITVDVQEGHFWLVARAWFPNGNSRLRYAAQLTSWNEIEQTRIRLGVEESKTLLDSGKWAKESVYAACCFYGWKPLKGEDRENGYEKKIGGKLFFEMAGFSGGDAPHQRKKYRPNNLWPGSKKAATDLILVSKPWGNKILQEYRTGRAPGWTIANDAPDWYIAQLNNVYSLEKDGKIIFKSRKETIGDHTWDVERYQVAGAVLSRIIKLQPQNEKKEEESKT